MSALQPALRLRLYAPRSVDATEATLLTPAAGASHSDQFKVASIAGVAGYQPYLMESFVGRRGRIDLKTRKLDTGTVSLTLIDKTITAGDNLTRWWSAYWGDTKGKPQGILKAEIDESTDGGTTWTQIRTMELVATQLVAKNQIRLDFRDRTKTLKMKTFVGLPHASLTYVAQPTLLPLGLRNSDYGKLRITPPLTGTTKKIIKINSTTYDSGAEIQVYLDSASLRHELNVVTSNLIAAVAPNQVVDIHLGTGGIPVATSIPDFSGRCRCHLKRLDTNAEGEFKVGMLGILPTGVASKKFRVTSFALKALETTDVGYLAAPGESVSVEIALYVDAPASDESAILLNDVDPATYISDICAGYFGALYRPPQTLPTGVSYGDPKRAIATNGFGSFTSTRPTMRRVARKVSTALEEIQQVCLENNWMPYLDGQGRLNLLDLELPATLSGIATITDADIEADFDPDWKHDPTSAVFLVDAAQYHERIITPAELAADSAEFPTLADGTIVEERKHPLAPVYIGSADFDENVLTLDAKGLRAMDGEQVQSQPRSVYHKRTLLQLCDGMARPFGYGLTTLPLKCRRTATVTGLSQGSLVIVDVDVVPDPGAHVRGGTILCRVTEYSEDDDGTIMLRLAFLGSATVADAPSLAQPALLSGNGWSGVTTAVTVNAASHPVEVRYAITDTGTGSPPADTSTAWRSHGLIFATGTFTITNVPPGSRVWVQGRSFPVEQATLYLPSAWTIAGGTGKADTTALPTPSSLTVSSHTDRTAHLTWTNGAADVAVELLLATPTSDPRWRIASLPPGTTSFDLTRLTPSTQYRIGVRHAMGEFYGTEDTEDVTTDASGSTVPDLLRFAVYVNT